MNDDLRTAPSRTALPNWNAVLPPANGHCDEVERAISGTTETLPEWQRAEAATAGYIVPPGEGDPVPSKPEAERKAGSANTGGLILVDEAVLAPGTTILPHRHTNIAEFFYVLEGVVRLRIGDREQIAPAGTFAFSPVCNAHGFSNPGQTPARLLIVAFPPEPGERYFEALANLPANATAADWEPIGRAHGVERVEALPQSAAGAHPYREMAPPRASRG